MVSPAFVLDASSIVLLGSFNPAIFQPMWLASHGLIRREEAEQADGLVFSPEVAAYKTDWLTLKVTRNRFEAVSEDPAHAQPLRDLVLSVFTILEHTPLRQMGINRHVHYRMDSEERWHRFGHFLVGKEPWKSVIDDPGTRSLTIQGRRVDAPDAIIQFVVEPSLKVRPGVYFSFNEHYVIAKDEPGQKLMQALAKSWESAHAYASLIAEHLLQQEY